MDPRQQATFIPKRPINAISNERKAIGFFSLVTLVIFICMGIAAGAVYFWKLTLLKQLEASAATLVEQEKAFDRTFINAAVRLNNRIETSKSLLNKHIAVTSLLDTLGRNTLQAVQFSDFTFSTSQLGSITLLKVSVRGIARDYTALAAQSMEIGKVVAFKDPVFSEFTLTQEGRVSFLLSMDVDTSLLEYRHKPLTKVPQAFQSTATSTAATSATTTQASTSTNSTQP